MSGKTQNSASPIYTLVSPRDPQASPEIFITQSLLEDLARLCLGALPHKAFGLIGGADLYHPKSLYPCVTNLRNTPEWKPVFESYGDFYKDPDLGFVIAQPEVKAILEAMESRGEYFVGVFHSHRYLSAKPTEIDVALSTEANLFSYIVSVANPSAPEIGVFRIGVEGYRIIRIVAC